MAARAIRPFYFMSHPINGGKGLFTYQGRLRAAQLDDGGREIIARGENDLVMVISSLSSFRFISDLQSVIPPKAIIPFCPSLVVVHYFNNGSLREMRWKWKCRCWRETTDPDGRRVRVMNFTARKQQNKQRC